MRPAAIVAVVVLCVNAWLLAWTELAWLGLWIGSVPFPISVLVALVTTPMLVGAAARVGGGGAGFLTLLVWVLTVGVAGFWGPAGVGVLPGDWRAILLVAAGLLPGMVVAARRSAPARGPRDTIA